MRIIRGIGFITKEIIKVLLFGVVRVTHNGFQSIYWRINGTSQQMLKAQQQQHYNKSAQILRIKYRHHFDFLLPYTWADYMCSHEAFVEPEYVLGKDNISLFFLTDEDAVFAECDEGVETWRNKYGAFVREATGIYAKKLIRMPIKTLMKLGEKVGPPKQQICFLFNVARCGSTLLTQMLEHTDQCVAISEPDGLNVIAKKYRVNGDSQEMRDLLTAYMNLLCKPVNSPSENRCFFIKLTAPGVVALDFIYKQYPESRCLFLYRHVIPVAKSMFRIIQVMPVLLLTMYLGRYSEAVVENLLNEIGISGKDYKLRYKNPLCMGTSSWAVSTRQYLDLREAGHDEIKCVRYEDIVADPRYAFAEILKHCNLPTDMVEKGLVALQQNSQKTSVLNRGNEFVAPEVTPTRRKQMDEVLDKFRLPRTGDSDILEGIIGHKSH